MARNSEKLKRALAVGFWLILWQLGAAALGEDLLLVSPYTVLRTLGALLGKLDFWQSIGGSLLRIGGGFLLGAVVGCLLASLAGRCSLLRTLFAPLMAVIRATPVASFVILALLWAGSGNLAVVIAFLMVLPVLYTALLSGLDARDASLAEMAAVFRVPAAKRLRYLTLPALLPWAKSGCKTAVGLAWKSGVAAEVIGLPGGSIGEKLYQTKLYLETGELFAWTLVIILLSAACEKLVLSGLTALQRRLAE